MGDAAAESTTGEVKGERWITHYSSSHRILLVGEGDFSFSACLARAFGSAKNMIATSYDDYDKLLEKYWSANMRLDELESLGCTILHGIDVKDMHEDNFLKTKRRHKELLLNFFNSARCLVSENGEIHVSHRDDQVYPQWKIRSSAENSGLVLKEKVEFQKEDYPGYENKRGGGIRSNETFPLGHRSFTFKFSLKNE